MSGIVRGGGVVLSALLAELLGFPALPVEAQSDGRGVTVSVDVLTVDEGSTATYTVVLDAQPTGPVTVTPSSPSCLDVSVQPRQLEFGTEDWDSRRTVTVMAADDDDVLIDFPVQISHAVGGANYDSVKAPSVKVVILERDQQIFTLHAPESADVEESDGPVLSFKVVLNGAAETASVDYATVTGSGDSVAQAGQDYVPVSGTLTFSSGSTSQEIEVEILDDSVHEGQAETFALVLRNARYALLAGGVTQLEAEIVVRDDDPPSPGPDEDDDSDDDSDGGSGGGGTSEGGGGGTPEGGGGGTPEGGGGGTPLGGGGETPPPPPEDPGGGGPPRAAITTNATCGNELCRASTGVPVVFDDSSSGVVRFRRWDFGDGSVSRAQTVRHAWSAPGFYEVRLWTSDGSTESSASLTFLVEASEPAGSCVSDGETACLRASRYAISAEWVAGGAPRAATVAHVGTNDSALFVFFGRENWEILVKVLDGCSVNGFVWVFAAATTDLAYSIRVVDTVSGAAREYRNEPGEPAAAINDSTAFPEACRP